MKIIKQYNVRTNKIIYRIVADNIKEHPGVDFLSIEQFLEECAANCAFSITQIEPTENAQPTDGEIK